MIRDLLIALVVILAFGVMTAGIIVIDETKCDWMWWLDCRVVK
ncbi:MAG TPA: hypothetical protein VGU20_09455 [Stellaceae bacterium]|nr:hypothetical protein [Stellaceae bacterium]